jgi:hypothetical protein
MILFKLLTKKSVKDSALQFQILRVNFHKFHARFSRRLSQLEEAIRSFVQDGFQKMLKGAHKMQRMGLGFNFFKVIPQRGR